jgi:hypothetical protein
MNETWRELYGPWPATYSDIPFDLRHEAISGRIRFYVRGSYFGESFLEQLKAAFEYLGFAIGENPMLDGSDAGGFLVGPTQEAMEAAADFIRERQSLRDNLSDEELDDEDAFWDWFFETRDLIEKQYHCSAIESEFNYVDWANDWAYPELNVEVCLCSDLHVEPITFEVRHLK